MASIPSSWPSPSSSLAATDPPSPRRPAGAGPQGDARHDREAAAGGRPGGPAAQAGGVRQDHRRHQGAAEIPAGGPQCR